MKFVIFDIDGTLCNTTGVDDKCYMSAFEETFKIDIRQQSWENIQHVTDWGITEEIIQREWNRVPTSEEYEALQSCFFGKLQAESEKDTTQYSEVAGSKDFFNRLKAMDQFQVGIATGAWETSAKIKLSGAGIDFEDVCFANSNHSKSREGITNHVIDLLKQKTGVSPEEIIYFGDGLWDYKTCNNLGIRFIGIDCLGTGRLKEVGATVIFNDFTDAEAILEHL